MLKVASSSLTTSKPISPTQSLLPSITKSKLWIILLLLGLWPLTCAKLVMSDWLINTLFVCAHSFCFCAMVEWNCFAQCFWPISWSFFSRTDRYQSGLWRIWLWCMHRRRNSLDRQPKWHHQHSNQQLHSTCLLLEWLRHHHHWRNRIAKNWFPSNSVNLGWKWWYSMWILHPRNGDENGNSCYVLDVFVHSFLLATFPNRSDQFIQLVVRFTCPKS